MPDAKLNASYQAYEFAHIFMFAPVRRPDKAFTPNPAKQRARCQKFELTGRNNEL
ncbi:hypothetical protein HMPREF1623_01580 [Escherichia coli 910096-2]|nr:hypothetical protein HMPREF1623_01580 [Escherichia coli 910096-2]